MKDSTPGALVFFIFHFEFFIILYRRLSISLR